MNSTIIPYQIRAKLLQLEPSTDLYWEETLVSVFDEANIEVREEINQQILRPKEIQWNRSENSFEYNYQIPQDFFSCPFLTMVFR